MTSETFAQPPARFLDLARLWHELGLLENRATRFGPMAVRTPEDVLLDPVWGAPAAEVDAALGSSTDLVRLPGPVHTLRPAGTAWLPVVAARDPRREPYLLAPRWATPWLGLWLPADGGEARRFDPEPAPDAATLVALVRAGLDRRRRLAAACDEDGHAGWQRAVADIVAR